MSHHTRGLAIASLLLLSAVALDAQAAPASSEGTPGSPRDVVTELYELVTFEAGTTPDWDQVRALFADEATVVLRTGRDRMTIFDLDGFVNDFVQFIEQSDVEKTGFTERILKMTSTEYGDIAHVLVLFDSHINGAENPPREGIDSFQLIRVQGRWKIISITNDRPSPGKPIPRTLFE